jgi:curved DNA-binding protein
MNFKDYYKILEVEKSATQDEIKKSFRKLAAKYHPDKPTGNEVKFKDISEAYEVLSDTTKRRKYDNLGSSFNSYRTRAGSSDGFDWSKWTAQQNQAGRKRKTVGDFFNEGGTMSDFFENIFGSSYGQQGGNKSYNYTKPAKGEDYNTIIGVTLEEAFAGKKVRLKVNEESIEINVKPGISNGQQLKLSGKGLRSKTGGPNGDLIIKVEVKDNPTIERDGHDIHISRNIDLFEAVLGAEKTFETISGKFNIKIASGTQQGKIIKLSGQGMPKYDGTGKGNLYIKLNITMPTKLSQEEKNLFQKIKDLRK